MTDEGDILPDVRKVTIKEKKSAEKKRHLFHKNKLNQLKSKIIWKSGLKEFDRII